MAPEPGTLEFDYEALTKDAALWEDSARRLDAISLSTSEEYVPEEAFGWAAVNTVGSYSTALKGFNTAMERGSAIFDGAAVVLRKVRDDYESTDEAARQAVRRLWEPVIF